MEINVEKLRNFKVDLIKLILPAVMVIIMSLCGILYAQQNIKIDRKANKEVIIQMIEVLKLEQKHQREKLKEQKTTNMETLKVLNDIRIQIILLNQKLKARDDQCEKRLEEINSLKKCIEK